MSLPDRRSRPRFRTAVALRKSCALHLRDRSAWPCANSPCRDCVCDRRISGSLASMSPKDRYLASPSRVASIAFFIFEVSSAALALPSLLEFERKPRCRAMWPRTTANSSLVSSAIVRGGAQRPWRDRRMRAFRRDAPQRFVQRIRRRIRQQSVLMKQLADCVHALAAAANDPALAARGPPLRAFRFSGLVHQRRIEAADTGGDDLDPRSRPPRSRPSRTTRCRGRCRGYAHVPPSRYPDATVHNRKMIIDEIALSINNAGVRGNRLESHGKVVYH